MSDELDIRPLNPVIGARVNGLDLSQPLGADTVAAVRSALGTHLVLFFPGQQLSPSQQAEFAGQFGEVTEAHPILPAIDEHPKVLPIDSRVDRANFWHTDITFMARPALGSILHALEVPEAGGDTLWVNMQAAYDGLAEPVRALLDCLSAVHFDPPFAAELERAGGAMWEGKRIERLHPVVHPVVRVHPETGRKGLFVNPTFTHTILGVSAIESDGLLRMLYRHTQLPEFQCRFAWTQGDVAFWDNRATMHYATSDYGDAFRMMHRVTLRGDRPVGPASH